MSEASGAVPEPEKQPEKQPENPPDRTPELRIGHAERAAALAALDEHFQAGRLDVTEYGDRSGVAGAAVVASELSGLFRDLPAPHPDLPGRPEVATTPAPGTPEAWERRAVTQASGRAPDRSWTDAVAIALPVLLIAAMVVMVVVFNNPGAFALFPFVFILAHRFGPHRRR